MKVLVLGGYGNVGRFLSPLILGNTENSIILSGRNLEHANKFKEELSADFDSKRIEVIRTDASNDKSLIRAFEQSDFIINSASTIVNTENIIKALLHTKRHYLDLLMSSPFKLEKLREAEQEFIANNQCIITDGGFHPGLPGAMIRFAASRIDQIEKANVGSLLKMDWKFERSSPNTITEFISEFKDFDSSAFIEGQWRRLSYNDARIFDFGKNYGREKCIAMMMEEIKTLPSQIPSLKETGFYISGFNWLTDYLITPIILYASKKFPAEKLSFLASIFRWSIARNSKPPFRVILQLVAEGVHESVRTKYKLEISHEDGYFLTALPAFICFAQYSNRAQIKPGLHFQSNFVDSQAFISDLRKYGCKISEDFLTA